MQDMQSDMTAESSTGLVSTLLPAGLTQIRQQDIAAALWVRRPMPRLQTWLDGVARGHWPRLRAALHKDMVCDALLEAAEASDTPECAERNLLIEDVAALSIIFASIMRADFLSLDLRVVEAAASEPFHVAPVPARLICTYRGAGTQYGFSTDGRDPDHVLSVPTGSPFILRGSQWPEAPLTGLVHRAPSVPAPGPASVPGPGAARLVLVLDPLEDLSTPARKTHFHA